MYVERWKREDGELGREKREKEVERKEFSLFLVPSFTDASD